VGRAIAGTGTFLIVAHHSSLAVQDAAGARRYSGAMTISLARLLYWAPRILGLLFVGFLALFILEDLWHVIPAAIMLLVVLIAWKHEIAGAVLFAAAGLWYAVEVRAHPSWVLTIAGPLFLIAALFVVSHRRARG
jgi:hypothetical protein